MVNRPIGKRYSNAVIEHADTATFDPRISTSYGFRNISNAAS